MIVCLGTRYVFFLFIYIYIYIYVCVSLFWFVLVYCLGVEVEMEMGGKGREGKAGRLATMNCYICYYLIGSCGVVSCRGRASTCV